MEATFAPLDRDDLSCVSCRESLLGYVEQVCPRRHFLYDAVTGLWLEQPGQGEHYFVCAHCGERLDEDLQEYLFDLIVPERAARKLQAGILVRYLRPVDQTAP